MLSTIKILKKMKRCLSQFYIQNQNKQIKKKFFKKKFFFRNEIQSDFNIQRIGT